eukprot:UN07304
MKNQQIQNPHTSKIEKIIKKKAKKKLIQTQKNKKWECVIPWERSKIKKNTVEKNFSHEKNKEETLISFVKGSKNVSGKLL